MALFTFLIIDAEGAEAVQKAAFDNSVAAIKFSRTWLVPGGQVSIGEGVAPDLNWLGCWSSGDHGDAVGGGRVSVTRAERRSTGLGYSPNCSASC
jgi:hypothetical protein